MWWVLVGVAGVGGVYGWWLVCVLFGMYEVVLLGVLVGFVGGFVGVVVGFWYFRG